MDMKIHIRTILLKSIPYLMSIAGGVILYTGAIDNAPTENLRDLIINVSASLLSIPLVFLLYDYTNSRVARQMKKSMANSMSDRLNMVMVNIIVLLREMMNVRSKLTSSGLNRMLVWRVPEISARLRITPSMLDRLHRCHNDLDNLLFHDSQHNIFTSEQTQILSSLARDMTHLINENKFHRNSRVSARYIASLMERILDWLDSDSVSALNFQQHLTSADTTGQGDKTEK